MVGRTVCVGFRGHEVLEDETCDITLDRFDGGDLLVKVRAPDG